MIAFCGSTTRKYTTALTFTDTLSREIRSCGGMSMTMVRMSTRSMVCSTGIRKIRPGPLTFQKRPSWNTTARSYSRRILIALKAASASAIRICRENTVKFIASSPGSD